LDNTPLLATAAFVSVAEAAAAAVVLLLVDFPVIVAVVVDRFNVGKLKAMAKKNGG